jgi:hypothetical protein
MSVAADERPPPRAEWLMPRATEAQCQATIVEAARTFGWRVLAIRTAVDRGGRWKSPIQGDAGFPDLTLAHPRAGLWFVELKRAPNRLEPEQQAWRDALRAAGAPWRLVWVPERMSAFITELAQARSLAS